ncbi:hypothetical protein [Streptomyces carpaticus]|uniref:hypothetical protein n=1 Tax=Streptomyces carpaticus TaxID=285558 RepID=UPI0031F86025
MRGTKMLPVTAAAFLLALTTACGGGGGSDSDTDAASGPPEPEMTADSDQEPAGENESEEESAPEQDSALALGESSGPVPFVIEHSDGERWEATVEVTVDRVELGENAALEGHFDAEDVEGLRPAAVYITLAHVSGDDLTYNYAGTNLRVRTAEGESSTEIAMIGNLPFEGRCSDDVGSPQEELPAGAVIEKCKTVLVPEDSDPAEVEIYMGPSYFRSDPANLIWNLA